MTKIDIEYQSVIEPKNKFKKIIFKESLVFLKS